MPHDVAEMLGMCECEESDQSCLQMKRVLHSGTCGDEIRICQDTVTWCVTDSHCRYVALLSLHCGGPESSGTNNLLVWQHMICKNSQHNRSIEITNKCEWMCQNTFIQAGFTFLLCMNTHLISIETVWNVLYNGLPLQDNDVVRSFLIY